MTVYAFSDSDGVTRLRATIAPAPGGGLPTQWTADSHGAVTAATDNTAPPLTIQAGPIANYDNALEVLAQGGAPVLFSLDSAGEISIIGADPGSIPLQVQAAVAGTDVARFLNSDGSQVFALQNNKLGAFGATPVTQPPHPVTVGDVVAALVVLGLVHA